MFKGYVKINGMWRKVYEVNDWWDLLCWLMVCVLLGTIGIQAWKAM